MRRCAWWLICLTLVVLSAGCDVVGGEAMDLKDSELAAALAVDSSAEGVQTIVELLHRDRALERQYRDSYYQVSAEGGSIVEAVGRLNSHGARQVNFAHTGLLILGRDVADTTDWQNFALKEENLRPTVYPVVGEVAADLLSAGGELSAVYLLENALEPLGGGMSGVWAVTLREFLLWQKQAGVAAVLPYAVAENDESGTGVLLAGLVVFGEDGCRVITDEDCALAWCIMMRNKHICGESVELANGLGVNLTAAKVKMSVSEEKIHANVGLTAEVVGSLGGLTGEELERRLAERVGVALENAVTEARVSGLDFLGLGRELSRYEPALWDKIGGGDYLSRVEVEFTVTAEVVGSEL